MVLQVDFELALGIWLLSGLFKKAAWLAALICFLVFSFITLYKVLIGAESCGCFGSVDVNPWVTLFAIDIPSVIALVLYRPVLSLKRKAESIRTLIQEFFTPLPSLSRFATTTCTTILILGVTTPILAFNEPAKITSSYEVLEPDTWVGKELPILYHIDIGKQLRKGNWLVLLYHHDCPDCAAAIPKYEKIAGDFSGNEDFLQIALIEVPPYGRGYELSSSKCKFGKLDTNKKWFVATPVVVLMGDGKVLKAWEKDVPTCLDAILCHLFDKAGIEYKCFHTNLHRHLDYKASFDFNYAFNLRNHMDRFLHPSRSKYCMGRRQQFLKSNYGNNRTLRFS